jgi:hypothetical protein
MIHVSRNFRHVSSLKIPKALQFNERLHGSAAKMYLLVSKSGRSAAGQLQAYSWVECQGEIVLGGTDAPLRSHRCHHWRVKPPPGIAEGYSLDGRRWTVQTSFFQANTCGDRCQPNRQ